MDGRSAPYPALVIARWLVAWAEAVQDEVSNLKLQKLLYYAQGHHLAERGGPLFREQIQAWSHGPVVPEVYKAFCAFGSSSIVLDKADPFAWEQVDAGTTDFLGMVWNTYGGFSAGHLRNMTHEEPPWKRHWRPDERDIVIPDDEIGEYFSARR